MDKSTYKYNLSAGPFGLCSGYWDKNNNVFHTVTPTKEEECCINSCKPFVKECRDLCKQSSTQYILKTCQNKCNDIQNLCQDNCQLSSKLWGVDNPIYKASNKFGCGNGYETPIDKNCVLQHKNKILKFCINNCTTESTLDCQEHCEYSYGLISGETKNPLDIDKDLLKKNQVDTQKHSYNIVLYIIYPVALSVILYGLYILFTLCKK